MQRVQLRPDTLDEETRRFDPAPLRQPLFLNSVPKSGSHLLQNIVRMFVPLDQQYRVEFIQHAILRNHLGAFDLRRPQLSMGHLPFSDMAAIELSNARTILLVRDPYDWVIARARFMVSDQFSGSLDHLKSGRLTVNQLFNLIIFGIWEKMPGLAEYYQHNALAWLGTGIHLVRYEELKNAVATIQTEEAAAYFATLFGAMGVDLPADWRERIRVGANPARSGTARENLSGEIAEFPEDLPEIQRKLVDQVAPGLRDLLGYQ
nr:sulfotransferase domain-containing protein [uncultured Sphingomonas sp.]